MTEEPREPRYAQIGEIDEDALARGRVRVMALHIEEILHKVVSQTEILKLIQDAIVDLRGQVSHAFTQLGRMDGRQDAHADELRHVRRDVDELKRRGVDGEAIVAELEQRLVDLERWQADVEGRK